MYARQVSMPACLLQAAFTSRNDRSSRLAFWLRWSTASQAVLLAGLLAGCGLAPPVSTSRTVVSQSGAMHGGQQSVGGALVQLYAVGTGDGFASTPLLVTRVTTGDGSGDANNSNATAGTNTISYGFFEAGTYYVQGLRVGTTNVTICANGGASRTCTVTVRPSGFVTRPYDYTLPSPYNTQVAFTPTVLNDSG